jgi:hypothetical protein
MEAASDDITLSAVARLRRRRRQLAGQRRSSVRWPLLPDGIFARHAFSCLFRQLSATAASISVSPLFSPIFHYCHSHTTFSLITSPPSLPGFTSYFS